MKKPTRTGIRSTKEGVFYLGQVPHKYLARQGARCEYGRLLWMESDSHRAARKLQNVVRFVLVNQWSANNQTR